MFSFSTSSQTQTTHLIKWPQRRSAKLKGHHCRLWGLATECQ